MQKLERIKHLKAEKPHRTINRIRGILEKIGIFTTEEHLFYTDEGFYSCRINIGDEDLINFNIGTNGKGTTPQFSLASAYGELAERLQNNSIFLNLSYAQKDFVESGITDDSYRRKLEEKNLLLDFKYGPDERTVTVEDLVNEHDQILKYLYELDNKKEILAMMQDRLGLSRIVVVPFFNVRQRSIDYLPIELIRTSSTGMCSGNTKGEALIQGISEILERFVLKEIHINEITPPTIPFEAFAGTHILERIKNLEKNHNMSIVIKDCSLGKNLPVLGVLIFDCNQNKYSFHLGADPSPITALERCFTELYQGKAADEFKNMHYSENRYKGDEIFSGEQVKQINFDKNYLRYDGFWPNSIFSDSPGYSFNGFEHPISKSDSEDLKYLTGKILNLGYEIYIRDVSFLGFPSFYINIPGMSERHYRSISEDIPNIAMYRRNSPVLFNLKNSEASEIEKFALSFDNVSDIYYESKPDTLFLYNKNEDLKTLDPDLLMVMLFLRAANYEKAFKYINKYLSKISDENRTDNLYYFCVRDFLKLKIEKKTPDTIKRVLTTFYGESQAKEVIEDLSIHEKVFRYFDLPSCFNCSKCEVEPDCKYFKIVRYAKTLQEVYKKNIINQMNLKEVFANIGI